MRARPLFDATPMAGAHAARGIGTCVAGMVEGFAALPPQRRPHLLLSAGQPAPAGFGHTRIRRPPWPLAAVRIPDPWPALAGERRVRRGCGAALFHATQPALIPDGPTLANCYDLIPHHFADQYLRGAGRAAIAAEYRRQLRRLAQADLIVVNTRTVADDVTDVLGVRPERIRVVPLAAGAQPAAEEPPTAGDYVVYSGSIEPHKNVPVIIEAMGLLGAHRPDLRLLLSGPWSLRRLARLKAIAKRAGAADRIEWLGLLSPVGLARVRRGALAALVPSRMEGFGLPVLEAMQAGTPVLASDAPALVEVAGGAARHLPADDPDAWARAIAHLADDPSARADLAGRGRARAAGFSWERTAEAMADIYAELAT